MTKLWGYPHYCNRHEFAYLLCFWVLYQT